MKKYISIIYCLALVHTVVPQKALDAYSPILDKTLQRVIPVDPMQGYAIEKVSPSVYVITDGVWQSIAAVSEDEVILVDAPESFGSRIREAVEKVPPKPITTLIYSHDHSDHIGGSHHLGAIEGLEIVALNNVAEVLREQQDPRRLVPIKTFDGAYVLKSGSLSIHLTNPMNFHSTEGDLFISIPSEKLLMVVDVLAPGYVPFKNLDLSNNVHNYLKVFDQILAYDFDVFIGGHLTGTGTREDVILTKAYVTDLYETVKRIHAEKNENLGTLMAEVAEQVGWDKKYLLFKVFLDQIIDETAAEIEARWSEKLAAVDVWSKSHAATMLNYVRWED